MVFNLCRYATDSATPPFKPAVWRLKHVFTEAAFLGAWIAASTVAFVAVARNTDFFADTFPGLNAAENIRFGASDGAGNGSDGVNHPVFHSVVYLQVSVIGQAVIFVSRSPSLFFLGAAPSWWGRTSANTVML